MKIKKYSQEQIDRNLDRWSKFLEAHLFDRQLVNMAFDDVFDRIRTAKKRSIEHRKLLIIEEALNNHSRFLTARIDLVRQRIVFYSNKKNKKNLFPMLTK